MKIRNIAREIEIVCFCRKKTNKSANNLYSFSAFYLNEKCCVNITFLDSKIQPYYRFIFLRINLNTATPDQDYTKTFHSQHTDETKQSLVIFSIQIIDLYVCIYSNVQKTPNIALPMPTLPEHNWFIWIFVLYKDSNKLLCYFSVVHEATFYCIIKPSQ